MYVSPGEGTARKSAHECTSLGTLNWRYTVAQDLRKLQNVCTRFFALRFCVYAANASPLPLETINITVSKDSPFFSEKNKTKLGSITYSISLEFGLEKVYMSEFYHVWEGRRVKLGDLGISSGNGGNRSSLHPCVLL